MNKKPRGNTVDAAQNFPRAATENHAIAKFSFAVELSRSERKKQPVGPRKMMNKPVRVLSERIMSRGFEPTVGRLMEHVQNVVKKQPGLISVETLSDVNDHHKYVVLSEWKSKKDYDAWVNSKEFKDCTEKINEVLDVPGKRTTIFKRPQDDIFLL